MVSAAIDSQADNHSIVSHLGLFKRQSLAGEAGQVIGLPSDEDSQATKVAGHKNGEECQMGGW